MSISLRRTLSGLSLALVAVALVVAILSSVPTAVADPDRADGAPASWDGKSYVVHEWGTFTSVLGSNGTVLDGLRHEETDLPPFVYDLRDFAGITGVSPKMETPVIYFYSPEEQRPSVRVDFPRGAITQWYPAASHVNHQGAINNGAAARPEGREIRDLENGYIGWGLSGGGEVRVLPPDQSPALPAVEVDDPWRFARQVKANTLSVCNLNSARQRGEGVVDYRRPASEYTDAEREKYLFYRGLGDFPLPLAGEVTASSTAADTFTTSLLLRNVTPAEPLLHVLIVVVRGDKAGFEYVGDLGESGAKRWTDLSIHLMPNAHATEKLVQVLADKLTETGLYHDESLAMARTWQHGYFREEGLRVLYVLPTQFVDRELPLKVDRFGKADARGQQRPDSVVRTFVGRTELMTPEQEADMMAAVRQLASGNEDDRLVAAKTIERWGRFAIPYLQRAKQLAVAADVKAEIDRELARLELTR